MHFSKHFFVALSLAAVLVSCEKKEDKEDKPKTDVTTDVLMGTSGKRWPLSSVTFTYYSSGGAIDSTVKLEPNSRNYMNNNMFFGNNNGVNGIYNNFDAQEILLKVLPAFGSWSLNTTAQTITFTCIANRFNTCTAGLDGEWKIIAHSKIYTLLTERLVLQRSVALPNGRKVVQEINLFIS